jgi:uncharacterized membrane protein (UPF0182 family)
MTHRRRLATGLVAVAAVLVAGRAFALLFTDHEWYAALGAAPLWSEKIYDLTVIHLTSAVFAGLFALVNLHAVRRSIISLALPRRLGNVEFGEEVQRRFLDRAAYLLSVGVALVMSLAVPSWRTLAALRLGTHFGETDPFFQMDLGFYTGWLPLESSAYVWSLTLLVLVAGIVIGLYALTPSLKWQQGSFHVSVRARRHLSVLACLFLLTMAWSYRLDGYELLIDGSGPDGMFAYVDHQWLLPAYISLSIGTVAAAALVMLSGWMGHIRAGFFTVSAVLIFSVALDLVLPSVVRRLGETSTPVAHSRPYRATRDTFTKRAYAITGDSAGAPHEVTRFAAFADSARISRAIAAARDSDLVYPGAVGAALVKKGRTVAAPLLGGGLTRLANAWGEQRLDLAWSDLPADTKIARRRDVRQRVSSLMPVFAQGSDVVPAYEGDTLVWVLELYSASSSYPLSKHYVLAGKERSYFRHSGTAIVNALTGRLTVVPSPMPDAIATTWRSRFPQNIRAGDRDLLDALTSSPQPSAGAPASIPSSSSDSSVRANVRRLYERMHDALKAGDLKAFGAAYDSLGAIAEH